MKKCTPKFSNLTLLHAIVFSEQKKLEKAAEKWKSMHL